MTDPKESQGVGKAIAAGVIGGIAASLASVGVLLLMDVEMQPAIIAGVVGAVVGSTVPVAVCRKKKD